jgi:hypothetical protein
MTEHDPGVDSGRPPDLEETERDLTGCQAWGGAGYTGSNAGTTNDSDGNRPPLAPRSPSAGTQALRFTAWTRPARLSAPTTRDYGAHRGRRHLHEQRGASGTVALLAVQADLSVTKTDSPTRRRLRSRSSTRSRWRTRTPGRNLRGGGQASLRHGFRDATGTG